MAGRTVRVEVVGDNRGLKAALRDSEQALGRLGTAAKQSQQSLSKIEEGFSLFQKGAAIAAGASAVAAGLKQVVDAASRLQQSRGAIEAVFGADADRMNKAAEAAQNLGLSTAEYGEVAAQLGSQLKNQGTAQDQIAGQTEKLIGLATDLAATYGGPVSEAVGAISALFRGEADPIERYGVSIKQAQIDAKAAADGLTDQQARVALLMEQTASAQGQWNREQDTFAVQSAKAAAAFEDMKASLGQALLPALTTGAEYLGAFASGLKDLADTGVGKFAVEAGAVVGAVALMRNGLLKAGGAVEGLAAKMAASQGAFTSTIGAYGVGQSAKAFGRLAGALPAVGAGLFLISTAADAVQSSVDDARISVEDLYNQLSTGSAVLSLRVEEGTTRDVQKTIDLLDELSESAVTLDTSNLQADLDGAVQAITRLSQSNPEEAGRQWKALVDALSAAGGDEGLGLNPGQIGEWGAAVARGGDAAGRASGPVSDLVNSYEDLADAVEAALGPLKEFADIAIGADQALSDTAAAIADAREAAKGVGDIWDENTKSLKIATDAQRNAGDSLRDLAQEALDAAGPIAMDQGIGAAVANTRRARQAFIDVATSMGIPKKAAQELADQYGLIPDDVRTRFETEGVDKALSDTSRVKTALGNLDGTTAWTYIRVQTPNGGYNRPLNQGIRDPDTLVAPFLRTGDADNEIAAYARRGEGQSWIKRWLGFDWPTEIVIDVGFDFDMRGDWLLVSSLLSKQEGRIGNQEKDVRDLEAAWEKLGNQFERLSRLRDADNKKSAETRKEIARLKENIGAGLKGVKGLGISPSDLRLTKDDYRQIVKGEGDLRKLQERSEKAVDRELEKRDKLITKLEEQKKKAEEYYDAVKSIAGTVLAEYQRRVEQLAAALLKGFDPSEIASRARQIAAIEKQIVEKQGELAKYEWAPAYADKLREEIADLQDQLNPTDAIDADAVRKAIEERRKSIAEFTKNIADLTKLGLSPDVVSDIANMGAEAGGEFARELLSDPALAKYYDATFSQLNDEAKAVGVAVADASVAGILGGIRESKKDVEAFFKKYPLKVFAELVLADIPKGARQKSGAGARTVNVNVSGNLVDPHGAAMAIRKVLADQDSREGVMAW